MQILFGKTEPNKSAAIGSADSIQYARRPGLASIFLLLLVSACTASVNDSPSISSLEEDGGEQALILSLAVLGKDAQGKAKTLPARLVILEQDGTEWKYRYIEDTSSTAFHKAMYYNSGTGRSGILTLGGMAAAVKLWSPGRDTETLWEADFGGQASRMRDAEIGDIYGEGSNSIVVVTHDQGVVATVRPQASGGFKVEEIDREPGVIVHEVELGDLNSDGVLELYATPSTPNRMDGSAQHGQVVRYVPAQGSGREEIVDLGDRHAKEILVDDLDGDGHEELYISVEAVSGGTVEIRRYQETDGQPKIDTVASLNDKLCRFLTTGDVDGDGKKEMVAATNKSGIWLLRPGDEQWDVSLIASDSSGFEHASILLDLDRDGRDELYVASDRQAEVRRYELDEGEWTREILLKYEKGLTGFTWNVMPAPVASLPRN